MQYSQIMSNLKNLKRSFDAMSDDDDMDTFTKKFNEIIDNSIEFVQKMDKKIKKIKRGVSHLEDANNEMRNEIDKIQHEGLIG